MKKLLRSWVYIVLVLLSFISLFPFLWMFVSSIKHLNELYTIPPQWWPKDPTFINYINVFFESNIPRYFINSTIISIGSTVIALFFAFLSSYGFARFDFKGSRFFKTSILASQMLPTAVVIVPLYVILRTLGLVNTHLGLILVYLILTLPLSVWMLTGYLSSIPYELEEAALIDGCSRLKILWKILLPLTAPGIAATAIYAFVTTWNEFIFALVLATDKSVMTLPIGLAEFTTEFNTDWGGIMAASVTMTIPIIVIFIALQRHFVQGLTSGATKG